MPERIQLKRVKGWRLPEGAINVARPTRWGNPFAIARLPGQTCWGVFHIGRLVETAPSKSDAARVAVDRYRQYIGPNGMRSAEVWELAYLRGHDLACWCPLDQPCHATVLLELCREDWRA